MLKIATSGSILGKGQHGFAVSSPCLASANSCRVSSWDDQSAQRPLQRAVLTRLGGVASALCTNAPPRFWLHPKAWMSEAHTAQRGSKARISGGGARGQGLLGGGTLLCGATEGCLSEEHWGPAFCPRSPLVPLLASSEIQLPRITPQAARRTARKDLPFGARQDRGQFLTLTLLNIMTLGKFLHLIPIPKKEVGGS